MNTQWQTPTAIIRPSHKSYSVLIQGSKMVIARAVFDDKGKFVKNFMSLADIAKELKIKRGAIERAYKNSFLKKTKNGFNFRIITLG